MDRIGFIGCGNMGGALAAVAAKKAGGDRVFTADLDEGKLKVHQKAHGTVPSTVSEIAEKCDMIFLGVKPQMMKDTLDGIRGILSARQDRFVVVTMAAGLTAGTISSWLDSCPVIRVMPNLPAAVGKGALLYWPGEGVTADEEAAFKDLMAPGGLVMRLPENRIDAASAVAGCGPAYLCLFIEAMIDGGVRCGLSREQSARLALQMVDGTAAYLKETGKDPAVLRGEVCSPAGSTIEGVAALEERAVRYAVIDAVTASYVKSVEMKKSGS